LTAASTNGVPNNEIFSLKFLGTPNATLELPVGGASGFAGAFTFELSTPSAQFTFLINRSGAGAFTARYEVNDECGAYKLFAGGGAGVN